MEDVRLQVAEPATSPSTGRVPVQVAARPQLLDPLSLGRALRPLRRRVASAGRETFDEDATADLGAEQRIWLPVLTPAQEPAFDLSLVIDAGDSMALWSALIREFRLLCEQLGAFRDIRTWYLAFGRVGGQSAPTLHGASPVSGARDPRELLDPSGRRLIVVVTDGVHPWWQPSGPLQPILSEWASVNPMAIIQPFPQRLWNRSMLRPAVAEFRANGAGRRTAHILRSPYGVAIGTLPDPDSDTSASAPAETVTVPVLELTPMALHRWARLTAGSGQSATLAAAILSRKPTSAPGEDRRVSRADADPADPAQLVRDFRASVSVSAYRLAGYLSSAAPLTLPVMRLVQQSMMPESGAAELAEVFLGGLLRRLSAATPDGNGDSGTYGFKAGVREILFSTITRAEALNVQDQVGAYLVSGQRAGRPFPALAAGVTDEDMRTAVEQYPSSFGRIRRMLLERAGGPYAEAARQVRAVGLSPQQEGWLVDGTGLPNGKIYQPMLFVGLGGSGCAIGAELERRMRDAICGADGNDFRRRRGRESMLPYQLPSCVQFVYADLDRAELARMPGRVVPGPEHVRAVAQTARYVNDLVPHVDSYPQLAGSLRLEAARFVVGWLPPTAPDEPRLSPLRRGAGQFPTIGRAALFGTFTAGVNPAVRDIREAIGRLANSGEDLAALVGKPPRALDVFVAFSVAGGTGCGIFYDYLHLIAHMLSQDSRLRVKIYPLVLMPSAFEDGLGGGRPAGLNAASALIDLFRLVDQQNGGEAARELHSVHDQGPIDPEDVAVSYPGNMRIVMPPGMVQTGFLFSPPAAATREDMHRSIVSLVMSLMGTEMSEGNLLPAENRESFADSFVNQARDRQVRAANGIGNRGVSTALAASLRVPVDELANLVSARLLRVAVEQLSKAIDRPTSIRDDMEHFLDAAGVNPLLQRRAGDFAEPEPARGARYVTAALNDRQAAMRAGIGSLKARLDRDMPELARRFDPSRAVNELLGTMDVFRVQQVVFGHPGLSGEAEKDGVAGFLNRRRAIPAALHGYGAAPPPVPEFRERFLGQVKWTDPVPATVRSQQDTWYRWAADVAWAQAWDVQTTGWRPVLGQVEADINALTRELTNFAARDHDDFDRRSANLYRMRVGVSYLLPPRTGGMKAFYEMVVRRLFQSHMKGRQAASCLRRAPASADDDRRRGLACGVPAQRRAGARSRRSPLAETAADWGESPAACSGTWRAAAVAEAE